MNKPYRYYARAAEGRAIFGFDLESRANAVALEFGPGAAVVDTGAQAYMPMLQTVERGESGPALVYGAIGGWDCGRFDADRDLLEAVKRGRVEIAHAFLAKGASADARDGAGRSALHWAAARGARDIAEALMAAGARTDARDAEGRTPRDGASMRGHAALAAWLEGC